MANGEKTKFAANERRNCYKCDGIVHNNISENKLAATFKCNKDKLTTCIKCYDDYYTALIALNKE